MRELNPLHAEHLLGRLSQPHRRQHRQDRVERVDREEEHPHRPRVHGTASSIHEKRPRRRQQQLRDNELEKRIPLAAQRIDCAELEELQELLHFPEEVALRLADTEYQLFYQVQPIDFLRQVTLDLGGNTSAGPAATSSTGPVDPSTSSSQPVRSSVATLIKRFNEVSAWVTQLIISQPTHDARRAVLSCVLRVALSSWNIGNFNGAMEIIAGLKSNKLKPFWLSITEKESLPVLDFLSAALLSAEYDRALSRALAMTECPVVPFFGAFLRELRDILAHDGLMAPPPQSSQQQQQQQQQQSAGGIGTQTQSCDQQQQQQQSMGGGGGPGGKERERERKDGRRQRGVDSDREHQRQVFISDYNGEDHHFTKIGPGGLINLEKIYRTQAVMDHISSFHQHYHARHRLSPTFKLIDFLKTTTQNTNRILAAAPSEKGELDEEYDCDVEDYRPVQPLVHDHGVSMVCLSSRLTKIDQHVIQILHHGSTAVIWEGSDSASSAPPAPLTRSSNLLLYLRLDRSCSILTWVRPSWSGLKAASSTLGTTGLSSSGGGGTGGGGGSGGGGGGGCGSGVGGSGAASGTAGDTADPFLADFNLSFNPEDTLSPGLLTKMALQAAGEQSTGTTLDDGFLDIMAIKEVYLGGRDIEKDFEMSAVCRRYGLKHEPGNECGLTILYGYGISDNRLLYIVTPPTVCRVWYSGLCWLIRGMNRLQTLSDRRLLWLREQYMQLYHEDGYCCGPLAADAIRSFGGRDWSLAGMSQTGIQSAETSGLRREVSMKIKKKQILSNQNFKDKSLRTQFVEPTTMCMESSYWRNPIHHRQSTPTTFPEHQPDVSRHHSLGHLAYNTSQPKYERERHGSTEHLWHGRHPRVGSILYDTQLDFVDFVTLFRSFSILIRKDLRDLFEQLAISYRSMAVNSTTPKVNGVKLKPELANKKPQKLGLLTRNSRAEIEGIVVNTQKKIYDAIAAASIFTNCAGIDTNNSQVITLSTFIKFLETRQLEVWTEDAVKSLIKRHEPDAVLRSQHCLSFEGFARYLLDKDNFAFVNERQTPEESDMTRPMSTYYIASSHNTYLTGHQLKGESSVELYSQVLLTGCRCIELDCWDGDDGYPMIYHGHTFTTKIPFSAVVETIDHNAFVTSPYPVILSIENHCSLQQQSRMAHTFQRVFGEKLVTRFLFEADYSDEPILPSPEQLKYRILIKNKKLVMEVPAPLVNYTTAISTPTIRPGSGFRHSVPGRTSSIISNTSSSSFNDDYSDDDYDDDDDEDNLDEKALTTVVNTATGGGGGGVTSDVGASGGGSVSTATATATASASASAAVTSTRTSFSHNMCKTSSTKRVNPDDKLKKRSSQISKELSDMVVYVQAIKFRGLNTISPSSSVKQKQPPLTQQVVAPPPIRSTCMSSSGSSIVSSTSNISASSTVNLQSATTTMMMDNNPTTISDVTTTTMPSTSVVDTTTLYNINAAVGGDVVIKQSTVPPRGSGGVGGNLPSCYHCSSINENTAKKLCRKQPLALVVHTQSQLMRTYPAGMRIDSSNFNPVIFWSFGMQMAALNYQTEDVPMQLNTALFETTGRCGFVRKPPVLWDRSHVMHRRFNPWDKEFDGLHSSQIIINVVSGQYVSHRNVNLNTYVEVEIIGIPVDCNKQRTRVVQKNALNPIWNDTFHFRVLFRDLAFLRFSVIDATGGNHVLAQRILPLQCLRSGYRHLRLRSPQGNQPQNMSTLFIYSRVEEESLDDSDDRDELLDSGITTETASTKPEVIKHGDPSEKTISGCVPQPASNMFMSGISGVPLCVKRRMFFLMVYGVVAEEPYTILKITQESSTQDVLALALQKASLSTEKINDYILVEEVARGWEKKDHNLPATQRVLDLQERPLQAQSQWKGEGRFILKRMGDDPSSRAWLSSIRSVASREREARKSDGGTVMPSNAWDENDTFLVCIYNVSPEIPYAILKVPLNACSQDVLAQALVKARRMEDPMNFVIVEELEWGGTSNNLQFRALSDEEKVYSAQSHWQTIGRFIMQERGNATPTTLRKNRITSSLRLATLDRISRGLNVARSVATNSIKVPVQVALSDPTTSRWKSKSGEESRKGLIRGKINSEKETVSTIQQKSQSRREVHSEGETLSDEETKESDLLATVSRLKKVSLRKFKEWKS